MLCPSSLSPCPEDTDTGGEGRLCCTQPPPCWITGASREARAVGKAKGGYGCIGGVKLNACAQGASRRGAPVPPVGGCETERAEFADQSRRISRLRYTSPRHRPRFSMGIGERRAVPTLADTHQAHARTVNRGRDAVSGIRSVTNDIIRNCGLSRNAIHVRYALKCDDEFAGGLASAEQSPEPTRRSSSS